MIFSMSPSYWSVVFLSAALLPARVFGQQDPQLLHQFANGSRLENVVALASGLTVATNLNAAELVTVDPSLPQAENSHVIYHDKTHTALLGLAQPNSSTLAAVAGNNSAGTTTPGTYEILLFGIGDGSSVELKKTVPVPDAAFLDGLSNVPGDDRYLLAADPSLGVVFRIDLLTGESTQAFQSPLLKPSASSQQAAVNGVHAQGSYLYFTNSNTATFGRIPMTADGRPANGPSTEGEVIVSDPNGATYDDFALGPDGSNLFYLCSATGPSINLVNVTDKTQRLIAGGPDTTVLNNHPVAAVLGQASQYKNTLFIVTAGPIEGAGGEGGAQMFALDVSSS